MVGSSAPARANRTDTSLAAVATCRCGAGCVFVDTISESPEDGEVSMVVGMGFLDQTRKPLPLESKTRCDARPANVLGDRPNAERRSTGADKRRSLVSTSCASLYGNAQSSASRSWIACLPSTLV